jgi:ATP-binding protein involved in chromosome partitioning
VLEKVKYIVAVASGKGGVGKSTTAVNTALALQAMGKSVGLLDADIYGPSIAMMLGVPEDQRPEVVNEKFFKPVMAHGLATISMAYLTTEKNTNGMARAYGRGCPAAITAANGLG